MAKDGHRVTVGDAGWRGGCISAGRADVAGRFHGVALNQETR